MSQAMHRLDETKKKLVRQDREKAIDALAEHIHYNFEAPPRGESIMPIEIFECRSDIEAFCRERQITTRAFEWLLKDLRGSHLLEQTDMPVTLSRTGVERYCGDS
jgi:hypothetical protein